jgi:lysyl-tRNA synthetase class 2
VEKVEPRLPRDVPFVLTDYPAEAAALARRKPADPRVAERWELYIGGLELANAYSELTDPAEQRARFEACAAPAAQLGKDVYPIDEEFLSALATCHPPGASRWAWTAWSCCSRMPRRWMRSWPSGSRI